MKLSIVIPAFEEGRKIGGDVESACKFLQRNNLEGEIIVVDDGSKDDTAEAAAKAGQNHGSEASIKVIRNIRHRGKGYAVRGGVRQTTGDYVMFADSGNCVPYEDALAGLKMLTSGQCEIAHGSRKMAGANIIKDRDFYRRICSTLFHWFVIHIIKIPSELTDSQCGFKIYRGDVARLLYGECASDGFMFDIEIILRATRHEYRIKEFPIDWTCDADSRLSPTRNLRRILAELMKIRRTLH